MHGPEYYATVQWSDFADAASHWTSRLLFLCMLFFNTPKNEKRCITFSPHGMATAFLDQRRKFFSSLLAPDD